MTCESLRKHPKSWYNKYVIKKDYLLQKEEQKLKRLFYERFQNLQNQSKNMRENLEF